MKRTTTRPAIPLLAALLATIAGVGDEPAADKVPFTPYQTSQRSLFKNGDPPPSVLSPFKDGQLDLEPFSASTTTFSGPSLGAVLTRSPGAFARRELLIPWLRAVGEAHLAGQEETAPLTVQGKLDRLDKRLRPTARAPHEGPDDRFSATNLQRSAQKVIAPFSGALCGNVPFLRSELEDAVTLFHPLPATWKRYGVNRGNLLEPDRLAPELMAWEEISGQRPLSPEVFSELLAANVRQGGKGLIFDEASLPEDPVYSFDQLASRPISSYAIAQTSKKVSASELSPLLLARYGGWISERLKLAPREAMLQAKQRAAAMARESNDRYDRWLGSLSRERNLVSGSKTAEELPALPPSRRTEDDYREALGTFRTELKIFWSEVEDYSDTLDEKKDPAFTLEMNRIQVRFPRPRVSADSRHPRLFERSFHAVRLVHGPDTTAWTWYAYHGDYPPDLAIAPEAISSKESTILSRRLKSCVPLTALETAIQRLDSVTPAKAKSVLSALYASCAVRYLDKPAVLALTKGSPKEWDSAVKRCQAAWPE